MPSQFFMKIALSAFLTLFIQIAAAKEFTFIAISDMPYGENQAKLLEETIIPAMLQSSSPFVIHMGDIKSGGSACSDSLLKKRHAQIMRMHPEFVFYTPGDNEWTDCDRRKTGRPVSELKKLDDLRHLFFSSKPPYPESWQVTQQALYPENKRWQYEQASFATVHLVGTRNGRININKDDKNFALAQVAARDAANAIWIAELFEDAKTQKSDAIIIATQADVEHELDALSAQYGQPREAIVKALSSNVGALIDGIVRTKTIDRLIEQAKRVPATEPTGV